VTHRVAIVASHVIQYQDPFFRLLAAEPGIDLTVLYCSPAGAAVYRDADMKTTLRWDIEMLTGYRSRVLRNFGFGDGYTRLINPGIVPALLRGGYDMVLFMLGWGTVTSMLGILACRAARIPFFLYGDSSFPPPENTTARSVRAGFLRALFGMTTGFMVSGALNAAYYRHYGADPRRFFLLPWAVDNERFAADCRFTDGEREALRDRLGIARDAVVFVFSAKLVERKDPMTLLRAFDAMQHRDRAALLFLGDGVLREPMERFVRERLPVWRPASAGPVPAEAGTHTVFAGFINQTDLPKHYGVADVFVLPSMYEPRGAVINEAMACGLPVIVTDRCGSLGDIVLDGDNALVYPAGDAVALARAMDALTADAARRARMAQRSREIIGGWTFARGVEGVKDALRWLEGGDRTP
jgi:glycosyltransferase involved in cell wall biosynthesis